jgi:hypothetical protein
MQQKVNLVTIAGIEGAIEYSDVLILRGQEGIYIETTDKIGTDNDGKDLIQNKLVMYPWEKVVSLAWTEDTLIESVKQAAILEALQDLEEFLEDYEDDEEETADDPAGELDESTGDARDDPKVNPYE